MPEARVATTCIAACKSCGASSVRLVTSWRTMDRGGCGQLGQRVHNAGDKGCDDIHSSFQQYRKTGEDGFPDDRHNGGEASP